MARYPLLVAALLVVVLSACADEAPTAPPTPLLPPSATAPPTPGPWLADLRDEPRLDSLISRLLEGSHTLGPLFATFPVLCSVHGELFSNCAAAGLTVTDHFEGVLVGSALFCEPCGTSIERPLQAFDALYWNGPIATAAFWGADAPAPDGTHPPVGLDLIAAGTLDPFSRNRIAELTGGLEATHLLEFRSRQTTTEDLATGFLLFVNPESDRPIIGIEPTTPTWTGEDYRREIGNWQPLYEVR